jgi:lambda family phage portal protein
MKILDDMLRKFGYVKRRTSPQNTYRRSYDAARQDRLSANFLAPVTTGDAELRSGAALRIMRARAREAERNNDYAKKFLNMCKVNVVGRTGFSLQNKARDKNGNMDKAANAVIESEWAKWGKKGNCTVDGRLSWLAEQELFIKTVARDGEFLARKIRGFGNPWRFAIQNLECDLLDENHNVTDGPKQNLIRMGIEYDKWDRPVAYHLRRKHPGDMLRFAGSGASYDYERVPASEIIHCFTMERSTQGRGIPWMHTAMRRLNQVGEYEFTEVVASRAGASKMGFYQRTADATSDLPQDDEDKAGNPIQDFEAGIIEKLPPGYTFVSNDPQHPTSQFAPFIKASLRGCASGLNVTYNSLANDLEGVNFSSMRSGAIDERDNWKQIQGWMITDFVTQIFEVWLEMLLLTNRTNLPYAKFDKFNAPEWRGRIFDWVDPSKDIDGELKVRSANWKSDRMIVAERFNMELEDLYEQIRDDKKLREQYGIKDADFKAALSAKPPATESESTAPAQEV